MKLNESIMKNLKESADNDRIVKVRIDYADDSIELTEENIKKEIRKYLPNARVVVIPSKNGRWPEVEITDKYSNLKSYISDIYLGGFDEDRDIDDFLVESVDNSSLANFIKDSINKLQTTDYTNCKYNLDENLAVFVGWSDGYDTEPLEDEIASEKCPTCRVNAVIAVRNDADWSDLDTLTVPYYTHGGEIYDCQYTISTKEDYRRLAGSLIQDYNEIKRLLASGELTLGGIKMKNLSESIIEKLKEGNYRYITGANNPEQTGYEYGYNSEANTDVIDMLNELKRYFTQSQIDAKEIIANAMSDPGIGRKDLEMLKFCAEKTQEMIDKMNSTWE